MNKHSKLHKARVKMLNATEFFDQIAPCAQKTVEKDIESLAKWLKCDASDLRFKNENASIERFLPLIHDLIATYQQFPKEEERTSRIIRLLKSGGQPLPVFIDEDDGHDFIMEGRHRVVAFYLAGLTTVPISIVRRQAPRVINEPGFWL